MTKNEVNEIRATAYRKAINEMTPAEMAEILLTPDGKGRAFKRAVLERLVRLEIEEERRGHREAY